MGFLVALRAFIEQTGIPLTRWETLKYKDLPYVKISVPERVLSGNAGPTARDENLFYAATGDRLIVTFRENVLQRALDRELARRAAGKPLTAAAAPPRPEWLGKNLASEVQPQTLNMLARLTGDEYQEVMQARAWNNLPILNQWKRRYPDQDPVQLHERFWQVRLECPGGGRYVWNDRWQTMESTVYGHPGQPKPGPDTPAALQELRSARFGLTLEPNGLRAAFCLERGAAGKK